MLIDDTWKMFQWRKKNTPSSKFTECSFRNLKKIIDENEYLP
jgi:hypothetical protein